MSRLRLTGLLALVLAGACVAAASGGRISVDRTFINMTAQDSTGVVWGTRANEPGGLYRWQGANWERIQSGVPAGGAAVGVWNGPDGGVVVLWELLPPGATINWYRGRQSKQIGVLQGGYQDIHLFTTAPDRLWMTDDSANIYLLTAGKMGTVYTFQPGQFFGYTHPPNQRTFYCPFQVTHVDKGLDWIWGDSVGLYRNLAPLQGVVIYDGRSFEYHQTLPGLPSHGITSVVPVGDHHAWVAVLRDGIYSVDTHTLQATPVAEPEEGAFSRVTTMFQAGTDIYVVSHPLSPSHPAETLAHRLTSVLWRVRGGNWQKVLPGLDDAPEITVGLERPWLETSDGLWVGSNATGLWLVPPGDAAPRLIDWRYGFPLDFISHLYELTDAKLLAVDLRSHKSAALDTSSVLTDPKSDTRLQEINPLSPLQSDHNFRLWGILTIKQDALSEWDGAKWIDHPLPGNVSPLWLSGLDADSDGNIWLFPGCQMGPMAVFNPANNQWKDYPSYQVALATWTGQVRFLHSDEDRMEPVYGPARQIVYMGACNGINYYDGQSWHLWNRGAVPGAPHYFFDGPAFFDKAGHLAVNIHGETWETLPNSGWQQVTFESEPGSLVNWFIPSPPQPPPSGCGDTRSNSLTLDRLGRAWWTWEGSVYVGVDGRCRQVLSSDQPQPFIDGRLLRRALIDNDGNVFFETLLAQDRLGEYVLLRSSSPPYPTVKIGLTQLSPDSVRADFSSSGQGSELYTWRLDDRKWSAPQKADSAVLQFLPSGSHTIQVNVMNADLSMNPIPASATVTIGLPPQEQVGDLIRQLLAAQTDDQREAMVKALAAQPPSRVLPALQAARANASANARWWIDAAIQRVEQAEQR
jgi:hypothetical protein